MRVANEAVLPDARNVEVRRPLPEHSCIASSPYLAHAAVSDVLHERQPSVALASAPLKKASRGQRVIVSGVDGPLADVVNGVRGTVIDQWLGARAGNQWLCKVELDTGRPIKQPLNRSSHLAAAAIVDFV